jgi:hypothetical protein
MRSIRTVRGAPVSMSRPSRYQARASTRSPCGSTRRLDSRPRDPCSERRYGRRAARSPSTCAAQSAPEPPRHRGRRMAWTQHSLRRRSPSGILASGMAP